MGKHRYIKMLALAMLVLSLAACDAGSTARQSTPTVAPLTRPAVSPGPGATVEDVALEPSFEEEEEEEEAPWPLSEETIEPTAEIAPEPTVASESPSTPRPGSHRLPDGPLKIVALGDSLTEGNGDWQTEGGGFPARILTWIDGTRPGSEMINLGLSGWTSQQMVEGQLPDALEADPDIALVWIGSNNLWYNHGPGEGEALDLAAYTNDIDTTLSSLTNTGAEVFIALLDDQSLRPYALAPDLSSFDADQLAHMTKLTLAFNEIIRDKAEEYDATLVDFYNTTILTDAETLDEDGIHPNSAGYDIIAQMWIDVIQAIL